MRCNFKVRNVPKNMKFIQFKLKKHNQSTYAYHLFFARNLRIWPIMKLSRSKRALCNFVRKRKCYNPYVGIWSAKCKLCIVYFAGKVQTAKFARCIFLIIAKRALYFKFRKGKAQFWFVKRKFCILQTKREVRALESGALAHPLQTYF